MNGVAITEYEVEVHHKGEPQCIITLNDFSEDKAITRAKSAMWMEALRDGREWKQEDITANIYEGVEK